jgi:putative salt-induced outer membrane protein YdiY
VQARHGVKVREHVELFGRAAYARDRFAGIDHRSALDAGVALTTGRAPRHQLTFEGGIGFTAEDRVAADTLRFATATATARYVWQVAPGTELREELATISDLGEARNWRAANATAVSIGLTRLLSLKVSNDIEYRHVPVAGFRRLDIRTAAAIALTLRARSRGRAFLPAQVSNLPVGTAARPTRRAGTRF